MRDGWIKEPLGSLCSLTKGTSPTQKTAPGPYPLVVTGPEPKTSIDYQFEGEAVCIPFVSSTGHGHASLKRVHYADGRFAVANLLYVAQPHDPTEVIPRYLWLYLDTLRNQLIVPHMRGTANVTISLADLAQVPILLPPVSQQRRVVDLIEAVDQELESPWV